MSERERKLNQAMCVPSLATWWGVAAGEDPCTLLKTPSL